MDDTFFPDQPKQASAVPATKTAGGMRITQKKNRRTAADDSPATMPNDKLGEDMPHVVEDVVEAQRLPAAAAREQNKALQKMEQMRQPVHEKTPKPNHDRKMGVINQPRPGF